MDFEPDRESWPEDAPAGRAEVWYEPFPVDVADHGDTYVLTAVLPGLEPGDVQVRLRRRAVLIGADFTAARPDDAAFRPERGRTHREIPLPRPIDRQGARATFADGLLSVTVQKRRRQDR